MINTILGIAIGLFFFIFAIYAYSLGLKHGKQLSNGITPKVNINPVTAIKEHKAEAEEKKQSDLVEQGINNIMSYDGTIQRVVSK